MGSGGAVPGEGGRERAEGADVGRPSDRQGAGRRWGPGAQSPGRGDVSERRERTSADRATAREPGGDGVRGRSPRGGGTRASGGRGRRPTERPPGSRAAMGSGGAVPGEGRRERAEGANVGRPSDRQGAGRRWGPGAQP